MNSTMVMIPRETASVALVYLEELLNYVHDSPEDLERAMVALGQALESPAVPDRLLIPGCRVDPRGEFICGRCGCEGGHTRKCEWR